MWPEIQGISWKNLLLQRYNRKKTMFSPFAMLSSHALLMLLMCYVTCAHAFSSRATLLAIVASVLSAEEATYSVLLLCQFYGIHRAMESSHRLFWW